jgi:hypothetical protein
MQKSATEIYVIFQRPVLQCSGIFRRSYDGVHCKSDGTWPVFSLRKKKDTQIAAEAGGNDGGRPCPTSLFHLHPSPGPNIRVVAHVVGRRPWTARVQRCVDGIQTAAHVENGREVSNSSYRSSYVIKLKVSRFGNRLRKELPDESIYI